MIFYQDDFGFVVYVSLWLVDDDPMNNQGPAMMYYVNDGVYGSFNCLLFDHAKVEVSTLQVCTYPVVSNYFLQ